MRQCSILRTLVDKQGTRLSDLAAESGSTPSAMTRVLEKLEAQSLVQRVRGAGRDGRSAMVAIAPRGREVRRRIDELMLERTKKILDAIPTGFHLQLLAALRVLNQAMGPEGCCAFQGDGTDVSVSCKIPRENKRARRKCNAND